MEYLPLEALLQSIPSTSNFKLLEINNCPTTDDALNLILNDEFRDKFLNSQSSIGISVHLNEPLFVLNEKELDEMAAKYSNTERPILILFHSNEDKKFFIRWRALGGRKMFTLEIEEDREEDLNVVREFMMEFLIKCLIDGGTGM